MGRFRCAERSDFVFTFSLFFFLFFFFNCLICLRQSDFQFCSKVASAHSWVRIADDM